MRSALQLPPARLGSKLLEPARRREVDAQFNGAGATRPEFCGAPDRRAIGEVSYIQGLGSTSFQLARKNVLDMHADCAYTAESHEMYKYAETLWPAACVILLALGASSAPAASVFNFDTDALSKATPFTDSAGGLSATFTGQAAVCNVNTLFVTLTGNALIQDLCVANETGPLSISFSANLSSVSFSFATAENSTGTLLFVALENGTPVGSSTFTSPVPIGRLNGEGFASFSGLFNRITISGASLLAIDNVTADVAVPEPGAFAAVGLGVLLLRGLMRHRIHR